MDKIPLELTCVVNGRRWNLYSVEFDSPDGLYSTYLYAISDEHAALQLESLKENGRIGGKIEGVMKA